jgi:DNA-binding NtrC family response regulator
MKQDIEQLVDRMISQGILLDEAVCEFEKLFILNIVNRHPRNLSKAAAALGIHRNTLSKRLAEYQNGHPPKKPAGKTNGHRPAKRPAKTLRARSHS